MNTFQTVTSFALTGMVVSAVAQWTKGFLAKAGHKTLYVVGLSIIGGLGAYFFHLVPTNWVETLLGVWAAANTVYLAITQYLPSTAPTTTPSA